MIKAAPPPSYALPGNFQIFPNPTAEPAVARINPRLLAHCARCCVPFDFSIFLFLSLSRSVLSDKADKNYFSTAFHIFAITKIHFYIFNDNSPLFFTTSLRLSAFCHCPRPQQNVFRKKQPGDIHLPAVSAKLLHSRIGQISVRNDQNPPA